MAKVLQLILLCLVFTLCTQTAESAHAYFILNSECSPHYTCTGDVIDISVICQNSKCTCDPRLGIYDIQRYQCVGKAGGPCLGDHCTRNSKCDGSVQTCTCLSTYEIGEDGRCVHNYGETCEENEDCKEGLSCYDTKCECRFPEHEYYDVHNKTCYSVAHSWDLHFKKATSKSVEMSSVAVDNRNSHLLAQCLVIVLTVTQLGAVVAVMIFVWRIGKNLREIVGSIRVHGYFIRSDKNSLRQDATLNLTSPLIEPRV